MTKVPQDVLKTILTLLGVVALVAGIAFAAGNYPTRSEWESSRAEQLKQVDEVKHDISTMQLEQVRLQSSIAGIEKSQARSERTTTEIRQKLDEVLEKSNNRKR